MDIQTLEFYATNAQEVANRYELVASPLAAHFGAAFCTAGRVLDVGCGSGRDLAELLRQGYQAYGVDGTAEFVSLAQKLHPELAGRVMHGVLPSMPVPFGGNFHGVLCCAVLMHLCVAELAVAVQTLKACLQPHGRVLISLPKAQPGAQPSERDAAGRLFNCYQPEYLRTLFEHEGFVLLHSWENEDALERRGRAWFSHLYGFVA